MTKHKNDALLTISDIAVYLKVSKSTLYKPCVEGKVPGTKANP